MGLPQLAMTTLSSFAGDWAYPVIGKSKANAQVMALATANRMLIKAQDMWILSETMKIKNKKSDAQIFGLSNNLRYRGR
jgi:hypothetical protein